MDLKDKIILGAIYAFSAYMAIFMSQHPDSAAVVCPSIGGLLGMTHWFLIQDDKKPDAP